MTNCVCTARYTTQEAREMPHETVATHRDAPLQESVHTGLFSERRRGGGEAVNFFLVDAFRMDLSVLFGDGFGLLVFGVVFCGVLIFWMVIVWGYDFCRVISYSDRFI